VKKKRAILVIFLSCLLALAFVAFFGIRRTGIEALQSLVSQNLKNDASSGQVMSFLDVQHIEHTRLSKPEFTQLGGNQNVIEAIKRNTWIGLPQKESIHIVFVFNESHELVRFDLYPVYTGLEISEKRRPKLAVDEMQRLANRYTEYEYAEAYQLYHRGLDYFYKSTPETTLKAREYFQQAIDKDPFYPQAYAGLAGTYVYTNGLPPQEAMPKAKAAARKAWELDGGLAETHVSMGWVSLYYDWDWVTAGKHFERAIALNPNSPLAHFEYANYLSALGRSNESITERNAPWSSIRFPPCSTQASHGSFTLRGDSTGPLNTTGRRWNSIRASPLPVLDLGLHMQQRACTGKPWPNLKSFHQTNATFVSHMYMPEWVRQAKRSGYSTSSRHAQNKATCLPPPSP